MKKNSLSRFAAILMATVMWGSLASPACVNVMAAKKNLKNAPIILKDAEVFAFKSTEAQNAAIMRAQNLPEAFDLRHVGGTTRVTNGKTVFDGGKNYVTQVKAQDPFSDCWSYAVIAASEASILYDSGVTDEEYKAKNGGRALDLSEKALAYYAVQRIRDTDVGYGIPASQIGEGAYCDDSTDKNKVYDVGGLSFYGASLFGSGIGPKDESTRFPGEENEYPYANGGKDGLTDYDVYSDPELRGQMKEILRKVFMAEYPDKTEADFEAVFKKKTERILAIGGSDRSKYSSLDDWSIDVDYQHRFENNYAALRECHILPIPVKRNPDYSLKKDGNGKVIYDKAAIAAVKSELASGRAVAVGYYGDQSAPGQALTEEACLNVTGDDPTWAQYTYDERKPGNHMVTIVGYDDNYSRTNFLSGKDSKGNDKTPPEDGAFIVKNSWGSVNDETPGQHNYEDWGINGSGYFYLSYYDKSITEFRSFDYYTDKDPEKPASSKYYINQYDLMPMTGAFSMQEPEPVLLANVFEAGYDQNISYISTQTDSHETEVTYEVYKLNDYYSNPRDGVLLESGTKMVEYGGYCRIKLNNRNKVKKGQHFSVIMTHKVSTDAAPVYDVGINIGLSEARGIDGGIYRKKGVVNRGESLAYYDGKWSDWIDFYQDHYSEKIKAYSPLYEQLDNHAIKAYGEPLSESGADSVSLSKRSVSIGKGQTFALKAVIAPDSASACGVKWKSSNKKVATVDKDGVVKGIKKGTATITATTADGKKKKATCRVTVTGGKVKFVKSISVNKTNLTLAKGGNSKLKTKSLKPSNAKDKKVTWISSDPKIATVNSSGKVTAKSPGVATISAFAGEAAATCYVTVKPSVTKVTLSAKTKTMKVGDSPFDLSPKVYPFGAAGGKFKYKASKSGIVSVSRDGKVTPIKPGTTTVKVTGGKKSATCRITVKAKTDLDKRRY
ncbi:MAG: Ig-like domain-containing protein [Lachnospiraceae bacterium]|nr:Ig-like domain-containing protein [Lachnospiraceae bacterium]